MLKLPLLFDDLSDVRALFVTCCVLHNMLLQVDSDNYDGEGLHSESIIGNTMCASFVLLVVIVVVVIVVCGGGGGDNSVEMLQKGIIMMLLLMVVVVVATLVVMMMMMMNMMMAMMIIISCSRAAPPDTSARPVAKQIFKLLQISTSQV